MTDPGPRQEYDLLFDAERMEKQEYTESKGNDGWPDHRERTEGYKERHRDQRMLNEWALD